MSETSNQSYEIQFGPKLAELCKKCSESITEDAKTDLLANLNKFTEEVFFECRDRIRTEFSVKFPPLQIKRCNATQFEELRRLYSVTGASTTAFFVPALGLIAVNVEAILKWNVPTFVLNLVLGFIEELLHASFPRYAEPEIKNLTHATVEKYLGTQIPENYKNISLQESKKPTYGQD